MGTLELLTKIRYQLVAATPGTELKDVLGYGSGFMLNYKDHIFLISAAHVAEPNWSAEKPHPSIEGNDVAIVTPIADKDKDGVKQSLYLPVGGFEFIESIQIDLNLLPKGILQAKGTPEPIDVTYTIMKDSPGVFHFSKDNASDTPSTDHAFDGYVIPEDMIYPVDENDHYFAYGRVHFEPRTDADGHPYMHSDDIFYVDMTYSSTINGNIHVFETRDDDEVVYKDWAGISGGPIISQEGGLVGIACSVLEGTHYVFALDIHFVLKFLDIAIMEENGYKS